MIKTCKNCAGKLSYDIDMKGLCCESCGSFFPELEFESVLDSYDVEEQEIDCNIYQCSSCGAEISVTDTEVSTFCIYCGNPSIVFSRVSKMRKPDYIIPFKVTKEEAMKTVRDRIRKGFFIPKEIKNYEIENMRGIYIPHHITHVEYDGSIIYSSRVKSGKHHKTIYSKRSAYAHMDWITTDASTTLADSTSQRLEPYYKAGAVEFDENYLLGFYSDMSDVQAEDAAELAKNRARKIVDEEFQKSVRGSKKKIVSQRVATEVFEKPKIALFPAWFLTFRYKNKPYTVIVNGQTGKLVGGVPWKKALFVVLMVLLAILTTTACVFLLYHMVPILFSGGRSHSNRNSGSIIAFPVAGAMISISGGVKKIKNVLASISRTSATTLTSFVSKRQKGD